MSDPTSAVEIVVTGPRDWMGPAMTDLVDERLIACAQITHIESTYRWLDQIETADEARAVLHTSAARADEVVRAIRSRHPYDVPCVLVTAVVGGDPDYLAWILESTTE